LAIPQTGYPEQRVLIMVDMQERIAYYENTVLYHEQYLHEKERPPMNVHLGQILATGKILNNQSRSMLKEENHEQSGS